MAKLIKLNQEQLFTVSSALAKAYAKSFSADTLSRATTYVEGQSNQSRNYVWAIIMSTQGKAGKLSEVYTKETAQALCKLTMYKLSQPHAEVQTVDAF